MLIKLLKSWTCYVPHWKTWVSLKVIHGCNMDLKPYLTQSEEKESVNFSLNWDIERLREMFCRLYTAPLLRNGIRQETPSLLLEIKWQVVIDILEKTLDLSSNLQLWSVGMPLEILLFCLNDWKEWYYQENFVPHFH